uniref:Uncharacterized protein n=1 Tax=Strongyloides stercoralis TaxID=6248 RepID=A0A0K0DZT2_STRER
MRTIKFYFFIFLFAIKIFSSLELQYFCIQQNRNPPCVIFTALHESFFTEEIFKLLNSVEKILFKSYTKFSRVDPRYYFPLNSILKTVIGQDKMRHVCAKLKIPYAYPTYVQFYVKTEMLKNLFGPYSKVLKDNYLV